MRKCNRLISGLVLSYLINCPCGFLRVLIVNSFQVEIKRCRFNLNLPDLFGITCQGCVAELHAFGLQCLTDRLFTGFYRL